MSYVQKLPAGLRGRYHFFSEYLVGRTIMHSITSSLGGTTAVLVRVGRITSAEPGHAFFSSDTSNYYDPSEG